MHQHCFQVHEAWALKNLALTVTMTAEKLRKSRILGDFPREKIKLCESRKKRLLISWHRPLIKEEVKEI